MDVDVDRGLALVAELAKKSGLVWISYDGRDHPVWHGWIGDAICVVCGGDEQPLPAIDSRRDVLVSLRSKNTRALVAQVTATVEVIGADEDRYASIANELVTMRQNVADRPAAVARWAAHSTLVRLTPQSAVTEADAMPDEVTHTRPRLAR